MRFSRSDRRAMMLVFLIVSVAWGAIMIDRWLSAPKATVPALDMAETDSFASSGRLAPQESSQPAPKYYAVPESPVETFPFDPNTADSTTLLRLGLAPWQVRSIYKYRAKGGRWHRPEDFKRTPGMTPELWNRLGPMVRIGEAYRFYSDTKEVPADSSQLKDSTTTSKPTYVRQEKFSELVELELNEVDTATLKKIPGIGTVRSREIIRYREQLGGFVSVEQLKEIPDLPDSIGRWFRCSGVVYRPLQINKADIRQLAHHPYLNYAQAGAIMDYRRNKDDIKSLDELRSMREFAEIDIQRLAPYIEF